MTMTNQTIEIKSIHARLLSADGTFTRTAGVRAAQSRQNKPEAGDIVRQYQAILRCMIELGYRDGLMPSWNCPTTSRRNTSICSSRRNLSQ
jgi:hypothetical protein